MNLTAEQHWVCPNCDVTAVTLNEPNRWHNCSGLKGLLAPMVSAGINCKVEAHEREDYVGHEDVRLDGAGRPIMSVVTTRDDGTDCAVYVPTAHGQRA